MSFPVLLRASPRRKVFLQRALYDCLTGIQFRRDGHKKVYIQAMRLVFVLLEKLVEPFFELDQPSIGGNEKSENTLNKNSQSGLYLKFMGELKT